MQNEKPVFHWMRPVYRVLISLLLPGIAFAFLCTSNVDPLMQAMIVWDIFALVYLGISWIIFFKHQTDHIRQRATTEDGSRSFVLLLILISSFASMFTVLLLMLSTDGKEAQPLYLVTAIGGMLLSWAMVHTTFTFHYAHLFYGDDKQGGNAHAGGLEFPAQKKPDYLDFAYFSFVIGMTFQVSDVEISNRTIRRTALLHGLLSFGLNTFVVALTINLVAGLRH